MIGLVSGHDDRRRPPNRDRHPQHAQSQPQPQLHQEVIELHSNSLYNDATRDDLVEGHSLTSQLYQKSLRSFDLTDLILTTDIEGQLHALNRKTGEVIWTTIVNEDQSAIEIQSHGELAHRIRNKHLTTPAKGSSILNTQLESEKDPFMLTSTLLGNTDSNKTQPQSKKHEDAVIWIVEPYGDGVLYQFTKERGLQKLPVSIKEFIMNSPFSINDEFVYTGSRHSSIVKINAMTGMIVESYGDVAHDDEYDDYYHSLDDDGPMLTLGKTVYDLTIHARNDTSWNITYVQWGPNNLHSGLVWENDASRDNLYIQPFHDNSILAMDSDAKMVKWVANLPFTTVNVFDVFKSNEISNKGIGSEENFIVVPHPIDQSSSKSAGPFDSTFIDKTKHGSWFALSESHYPSLVRSAPIAKYITNKKWRDDSVLYNEDLFSIAIKGVHDNSIKDKIDKSDDQFGYGGSRDLAIYNPIQLPATALPGPVPLSRRYPIHGRNGHNAVIPDSAKYYENFPYDMHNEGFNSDTRVPTSTYNSSFLKDFLIRILENVIVAVFCVIIVYLLNKFGIIDLNGITPKKQIAKSQDEDEIDENEDGDFNTSNPKSSEQNKTVKINEEVEILKSDDQIETDVIKKKRKRGSRAGKRNKKLNPTDDSITPTDLDVSTSSIDGNDSEELTIISNSLSITDEILGFGSHGTIVFKGYFENRPVAVKRMLIDFYDVASHEISLLQESDDHSNVIRYFCSQEYNKFLYIALELCNASLEDVIEKKIDLGSIELEHKDILYQIANGVFHLHSLKIVHRDIKPQNILAVVKNTKDSKNDYVRFLISDFGLCKRLEADQSSFRGTTANAAGTSGWRAPELLIDANKHLHELQEDSDKEEDSLANSSIATVVRLTRALDIFSAGCVFYYVLTNGKHPFGDRFSREGEIIKGNYDLKGLDKLQDQVEISDLIRSMIDYDPIKRPDIISVMRHPYFWSVQRKMEFLLKISDRFEIERRDPPSDLLIKFESVSVQVLGKEGWFAKFGPLFLDNLGKYRKYNTHRLMDLLRAIRNKHHHYQDMPEELAKEMGSIVDGGFYRYFQSRFPQLLMAIHGNCRALVGHEEDMAQFYT